MSVGANFFVVPAGRHFPLFYPLSSKYRVIRQQKTAEDNLLFRRKQQQIYPIIQDFLALRVLHRPPEECQQKKLKVFVHSSIFEAIPTKLEKVTDRTLSGVC
jgi:hypothetical protein